MKRIVLILAMIVSSMSLSARKPCWECFIEAIIQVESHGDESADDGHGCWGILQLTDIYVREVNRLYGTSYTHQDAFDREKSLQMFRLMQDAKNPEHDFRRALEIHNPHHPQSYAEKVYREYNKILNDGQKRHSR